MKRVVSLLLILLASNTWSKESVSLFVKHEFNSDDQITGVGASFFTQENFNSNIRGEGISSIHYAEVLDEDDQLQDYVGWDIGLRVGYYDDVFIYVEGGLDLLEIIADDTRNDRHYINDNSENNNDLDGYGSIGAGIDTGKLRIEGFIKARQIDADYWRSKHQIFYGAQLSLIF